MGQCFSLRQGIGSNGVAPAEENECYEKIEKQSNEQSEKSNGERPKPQKVVKTRVIEVQPSTKNESISLADVETERSKPALPRQLPPLPASVVRKTKCVYRYQGAPVGKKAEELRWKVKEFRSADGGVDDGQKQKALAKPKQTATRSLVKEVNAILNLVEEGERTSIEKNDFKWPGLANDSKKVQIETAKKRSYENEIPLKKTCSFEEDIERYIEETTKAEGKQIKETAKKCSSENEMSLKKTRSFQEDIQKYIEETTKPEGKQIMETAKEGSSLMEISKSFNPSSLKKDIPAKMFETSESKIRTSNKTDTKKKPNIRAEIAHLAVRSQFFGHLENENQFEATKDGPRWKLQDMPVQPVFVTSSKEIQHAMRTIESEMNALLKPEEKRGKRRSVAFTIGRIETARAQTPGCVPQRLLKYQKSEVDHKKIDEKLRRAEVRRNASIARRVQSAKHRSAAKKSKFLKEYGDRKEKQDLKDRVDEKLNSAHVRRNDVINQRVELARLSEDVRKISVEIRETCKSEYEQEVKVKVDRKIKAATERRNEILSKKVQAAKKKARTELVNEREKKTMNIHKNELEVKMSKVKANRERVLRRKLRSLVVQEKKRELARKQLARQRQDEEEKCQTFFETETYEGDDDLGEHDWDFEV